MNFRLLVLYRFMPMQRSRSALRDIKMPMMIPVRSGAETGSAVKKNFDVWFSQIHRQQSLNIAPWPVMSSPPVTVLTKATGIAAAAIVNAGSGYAAGDNLTPAGGECASAGRIRVLEVDESGAITGIAVQLPGVYSVTPGNPVAVTGGKGSGATFTLSWNAGIASSIYNGKTWPRTDTSFFKYTGYDIRDTISGYRGNGVQNGTQCVIEFQSDAPAMDFRFVGGNGQYDLYVDGYRVSSESVRTDTSGAPYIYTVDWRGVSVTRHYRLCGINTEFGGVITGPDFTVSSPRGNKRPLAWQMGDSYTVGVGANQGSFNDFRVMCDLLGIDGIADGISGSGWGSQQEGRVPEWRVRNKLGVITQTPQYVFLSLGYNDAGGNINTIRNSFVSSVQAVREVCPLAKIFVIGPATPIGHTKQLDEIRAALMNQCSILRLTFIDVRDVVNSSNAGIYTGSDNTHPSDAGHLYRGVQIALRVQEYL
ncbi:SGNH/GDSL hydrolase family protein [Enterobacter quasiroggenkampii]|uniref:SGNH/GDSL hydrolase family protein n=1 Tax=Enterobacter quasiroggenkampii TaxID=2497436 RepID=UPI0021CE2144|nr:SGNH/GDSL hydrolase family protein [Enterobacter quasiroggenkampii]MCU6406662.1 SGNH/GDSL hydrolase family protein [Enterobacter quasiroggenkampii]